MIGGAGGFFLSQPISVRQQRTIQSRNKSYRFPSGDACVAGRTTVTWIGAERTLSRAPPLSTNVASSSVCAPGVRGGSPVAQAKATIGDVVVGAVTHETLSSAVRVPSTYIT